MTLGQLREVAPDNGQLVQSSRSGGVVVAARAENAAVGMLLGRREVDGIVGDRAQRDGRCLGRSTEGPLGLPENPRENPEGHRRLVRSANRFVAEPAAQRAQRPPLVLVGPEFLQRLVVGVERSSVRLHRECKGVVGEAEAPPCSEHGICEQRSGTRRPVDQRQALLCAEIVLSQQGAEEVREREDLSRASVTVQGNRRQRSSVELP